MVSAVNESVQRLASRTPRPEASIQADVYLLLTSADLGLDQEDVIMESPVDDGTRRRIDIEAGHLIIEVKKDLRRLDLAVAENQLAGYVLQRSQELGQGIVGVLTDGTTWKLYLLSGSTESLQHVSTLELSPTQPDGDTLLIWLESVLATRSQVAPTPTEIEKRLGSTSSAHLLDVAALTHLYEQNRTSTEIALKRQLWAKLLRTAFGTAFVDDDELFINHTLLVVTAEIIAHAAIGWNVAPGGGLSPLQLTSGSEFAESGIYGVVEADFFDWIVEVDGGSDLVSEMARRIAVFDWSQVHADVLKVLYESIIPASERQRMGEYYTPDWLANRIVEHAVTDPLNQRVIDPSCGSGTFVFHAVRAHLEASEAAGFNNGAAVASVTGHVIGMDVHPVAVTLARVTYLLAIGLKRLNTDDRHPISIPVYLGDSLQWEQHTDLFGGGESIRVSTAGDELIEGGGTLFDDDLLFPRSVLADARRFDMLVLRMAELAQDMTGTKAVTLATRINKQFGLSGNDATTIAETFTTMRSLHHAGRNHIWGYYVRNLVRPLWLSEVSNRGDVLVGNPPWLRYSKMTEAMQNRYRTLAGDRGLLAGGRGASARELSTLFVVRAVELYLRGGGRFAFVMPQGVMSRQPHRGFRSGKWSGATGDALTAQFFQSWDLEHATTGFPNHSCVIHGTRTTTAGPMPQEVELWTLKLPRPDMPWDDIKEHLTVTTGDINEVGNTLTPSPYESRFRQGAILLPRVLVGVEPIDPGPLGAGAGRIKVQSFRSTQEKTPWKELPSLIATVDRRFVRPMLLGETVLPFRLTAARSAVVPVVAEELLEPEAVENYPGLATWWDQADRAWRDNCGKSHPPPLAKRIDYHAQLSAQLPIPPVRVVYTKSGNTLAACMVRDTTALIDHKLYWATATNSSEAAYLEAILNSATLLARIQPLQARGLFGPRDFDKAVFSVPFPEFSHDIDLHQELAALGQQAQHVAEHVDITAAATFQAARKLIRTALTEVGVGPAIENAVAQLVPLELVAAP